MRFVDRSATRLGCGRGSMRWRLERGVVRRGYVTDGSNPAKEFHRSDFQYTLYDTLLSERNPSWQELYDSVGSELEQRPTVECPFGASPAEWIWQMSVGERGELLQRCGSGGWDVFYERHGTPRFFKERRYLTLEFPVLLQQIPPIRVLDLGCGYGSSILPLLKINDACRCLGVDVSPAALEALHSAADQLEIGEERMKTALLDMTQPKAAYRLSPFRADYALMIFSLSALDPNQMIQALQTAYLSLEAGGKLLFRDYGFCDMSQLRYPPDQTLSSHSYLRQDGTRAHYFKREELQSMVISCGFRVEECGYVCLAQLNRRTGQEMKRVFVHGIFQKA